MGWVDGGNGRNGQPGATPVGIPRTDSVRDVDDANTSGGSIGEVEERSGLGWYLGVRMAVRCC